MSLNTRSYISILFLLFSLTSFSQEKVKITGRIVDESSGQSLPYVTIAVKSVENESILSGTTTNDNGFFSISVDPTPIYLEVSFIGFETKVIKDISIEKEILDLGKISLGVSSEQLSEVEISAEKSVMEFKLDKRVFNVGKDLASTGMGAMDLLDNVPSVNVDIEGVITLRGNSGVQILIDGKPSVLTGEGNNALGTLTADMIESIELITNPSAKYEAEGSSGIINIILKKEEKKGFNGSASVNAGIPDNQSVGISLNKRTENFNFFTQIGGGYRSLPRYSENYNFNLVDSTKVLSEGTEYRNERFFNFTLGTDYHINKNNVITLSGNYAFEDEDQPSETEFKILGSENQVISNYRREENTTAGNPKYQYDLQYEKKFNNHEDHELLFSTQGSFFGKKQESTFENIALDGVNLNPDQEIETDFYQRDFVYKLDYTNPLTEKLTIEAGSQYELNDVGNDYIVYNENASGDYIVDSTQTNDFKYDQKVLGIYATASMEWEKFGVKFGSRVENTDLNTHLVNTEETNKQNYTNFFPSAHTSYKFSTKFSMQAGYSRRIYRPRLWDLNPFFNIRNNYNIRRGNPDLQPEFADSYELTGIFLFDKVSLNSSLYYLYTQDVIERVTFYENDVSITTPINIGYRYQTGIELNGKYTPIKWLVITGDFNYGYFIRDGDYNGQNFDFNGDQWSTEATTRFKLPKDYEVELTGNYRSSYRTVQGEVSGYAFADIGVRKKLWKGKAVVNLSVRDVFASRIRESTVDQPGYYLYDFSQRGRFIAMGFSYSFGKGEAMTYSGRRR